MDWAGIGSFASGLIGNVWDYIANSETNSTNQYIAQETNWLNQQNFYDSLEWAKQQYEQEKAENRFLVDQAYQRELENRAHNEWYNSPEQMMERYRQAGINPYLAMAGGSSLGHASSGNIGAQVGQNPHLNMPNRPEMVTGAPMIPVSSFGNGISQSLQNFLSMQENERADKRLGSDIAAAQNKMELDYMRYLDEHSVSAANSAYLRKKIAQMDKDFQFEHDKFQLHADWQNFQKSVIEYQKEQEDRKIAIQEMLASSGISLNVATISHLNQLISESKQKVFEMQQNGVSQREIEGFVSRQERAAAEMVEMDAERKKRQNVPGARQSYTDFTDWLLTPFKGIIGASANYSRSYSTKTQ